MTNIFSGGTQEENTGNIPESTGTRSLAGLLNAAALSQQTTQKHNFMITISAFNLSDVALMNVATALAGSGATVMRSEIVGNMTINVENMIL